MSDEKKQLTKEELEKVSGGIATVFTLQYDDELRHYIQEYFLDTTIEKCVVGKDYLFFRNKDNWVVGTVIFSGKDTKYYEKYGWCVNLRVKAGVNRTERISRSSWYITAATGYGVFEKP